jgi:hypothetical protein
MRRNTTFKCLFALPQAQGNCQNPVPSLIPSAMNLYSPLFRGSDRVVTQKAKVAVFVDFLAESARRNGRLIHSPMGSMLFQLNV